MSAKLPKNAVKIDTPPEAKEKPKEAQTEMEIKSALKLEETYPDFVKEIRDSTYEAAYKLGVQAERERLKALDSLNAPEREAIIMKAKYEDPKDARDIAIDILQATNAQTQLTALHQDAGAVNEVLPPSRDIPQDQAEREAAINAVANELNKMRGYK